MNTPGEVVINITTCIKGSLTYILAQPRHLGSTEASSLKLGILAQSGHLGSIEDSWGLAHSRHLGSTQASWLNQGILFSRMRHRHQRYVTTILFFYLIITYHVCTSQFIIFHFNSHMSKPYKMDPWHQNDYSQVSAWLELDDVAYRLSQVLGILLTFDKPR